MGFTPLKIRASEASWLRKMGAGGEAPGKSFWTPSNKDLEPAKNVEYFLHFLGKNLSQVFLGEIYRSSFLGKSLGFQNQVENLDYFSLGKKPWSSCSR